MSNLQKAPQHDHSHASAKTNKPEPKTRAQVTNPAQVLASPENAQPGDVLSAQQQVGNQVVQRAIDHGKRRNSVTDDKGNLNSDLSKEIQGKRGSGSPLPDGIRKEVSKKFGRSFGDVRVHTDDKADKLSRTISARAFTIGSDIFFKSGVFNPGSSQGRETLIHELTHVVQQSGAKSAGSTLKLGAPDTAMEKEADKMGKKHSRQNKATIAAGTSAATAQGNAIQRKMSSGDAGGAYEQEADRVAHQGGAGADLSGVRVHAGAQSEAAGRGLQAQAYAQGSNINFGAGQERHLPHEAWHVVQQRQGRIDPAVQMQPAEEEELQMQPAEEEELQMQPDSGGVVQRAWEKDDSGNWKKKAEAPVQPQTPVAQTPIPNAPPPTPRMQLESISQAAAKLHPGPEKKAGPSFQEELQAKSKDIAKTSAKSTAKIKTSDDKEISNQHSAARIKKGDQRRNLMNAIQDSKTSPEQAKAAQEKLDLLHKRSKWGTLKSMVKRRSFDGSYAAEAKDIRKNNLKEAARGGDDKAFEAYKSEKAERKQNSTGTMVKGALGAAGGAIGGFLKSRMNLLADHRLGKKKEEEAPEGKGGGGNSGTLDMITQLHQENQKLRAQVSELQKKKPAPEQAP